MLYKSQLLRGGKGEIRTHTGHRMKVLHNHYATLPYRNTLLKLSIKESNLLPRSTYSMPVSVRLMCFYIANSLRAGIEPALSPIMGLS